MNNTFLLIGGNLGDRLGFLQKACAEITLHIGTILKTSSVYETAPWGNHDQAHFLNQVLLIETALEPIALLNTILSIEKSMGRIRNTPFQARTIDIDILYFNDLLLQLDGLTIPHPRIFRRKFVLIPMHEIAPNHFDPFHQKTIHQMLKICTDDLIVNTFLVDMPGNK